MQTAMRWLVALALPGLVFGWLTRVTPLEFASVDPFFYFDDTWGDVLAALANLAALAILVVVTVAIVNSVERPGPRARR
jgi:hypothetical protein